MLVSGQKDQKRDKYTEGIDMDITIGIICMQMQERYQIETILPIERDVLVKGFQIWDGEDPKPDILYVCQETPPAHTRWNRKMQIGAGLDLHVMNGTAFTISVKTPISFHQLVNSLQEIFQDFYHWQADMEQLFYKREDLTVILNKLEETYGLVSTLVDKDLKHVALSESYSLYHPHLLCGDTMPLDMLNEIMGNEHFRNAEQHEEPFVYPHTEKNSYSYCYNIKISGRYEARLLVENKKGERFYGGLSLVGYVGEHLEKIIAQQSDEKIPETAFYDFYNILKDLLQGLPKSEEEILHCLQVRGWQREHTYQLYVFQFIRPENGLVTRRYYQVEMERLFQECCILVDEEYLCCIWNLSLTDPKAHNIRQELAIFLRENLCKAGISQEFTDISQLKQSYLEAAHALQIGTASNSTWWYHSFKPLILPYILQQAIKEIDVWRLYHPAIRTLIQYDQKEHTELVQTAYLYMKHRYNVTQTAEALFIHRTTMLFRLRRIELLTGIDWDDWKERLHMAITFELMEKNEDL
jgi:hypothetical protein